MSSMDVNGIQFRPARPDEIRQVAELRWLLQADDAPDVEACALKAFVDAFCASRVAIDDYIHFVAIHDAALVAVMSLRTIKKLPTPSGDGTTGWGYLTNCYTRPAYRNRGIGSRLLDVVRRCAVEQDLELLIVWPSDQSHAFYRRAGFNRPADPLVLPIKTDT